LKVAVVISLDAELAPAPWEFGYSTYQFLDGGRIAVIIQEGRRAWLGIAFTDRTGIIEPVPLAYTWIKPYLGTDRRQIAIIGATPDQPAAVTLIDPAATSARQLTPAPSAQVGTAPRPESFCFTTRAGRQVHGLLHPGSGGVGRPLLVRPHPGPTANAQLRADPWIAFFVGHGFAVLEIDYSGSTGYGRRFRNALRGHWGVLDATDCVDAVAGLVARGDIDQTRVGIHGSSAGGYTAFRALAMTDVFAAAAVRHAVIDPDDWRRAAPKFQAHHADLLVAPATRPEILRKRSVFGDSGAIVAPVLIIHGERDTITPITHAQRLADLMGERASLLTFADEGHSLRQPENQRTALNAELAHFRRALRL
jgi:dipeptidyl aminopeptidase/acylaminoacyl peptidase